MTVKASSECEMAEGDAANVSSDDERDEHAVVYLEVV